MIRRSADACLSRAHGMFSSDALVANRLDALSRRGPFPMPIVHVARANAADSILHLAEI